MPAVLNASNEIAVQAFCDHQISFTDIWETVSRVMEAHEFIEQPTLEQILAADSWARELAKGSVPVA
jgi:1-deoxy-D-xylulose-5-phosphate reductoisomerase